MSKSYTVNGNNMLNKCIHKATEESCSIIMELNNVTVARLLSILYSIDKYSDITIVLNINPDEKLSIQTGVFRKKEKVDLLSRKLDNELYNYNFTFESIYGINKLNTIASLGKLKIFIGLNTTKSTQYIRFKYNNNDVREIIADTYDNSNEICVVTQYIGNEDKLNNLGSLVDTEINSLGLNCVSDVVDIINNRISTENNIDKIYNKALFEINKHHINTSNTQTELLYNLNKSELNFQSDGVNSLISILLKYNVAYLSDSVGLGKTIVTLRLLAKTGYNALVITPNELVMQQWMEYTESENNIFVDENRIHYTINSSVSLDKVIKSKLDYDIVIFDEAQNFRNANTLRYKKAQEICAGKLVLLLGATPINNNIADIEYQLMLGLDENKSYDFGVGPIGEYFKNLRKITNKSKTNIDEYKKAQKLAGSQVRKTIISKIMVRRTRQDIEKYYKEDIDSGKLHFPKVLDPVIVKYSYTGIKLARTLDILSGYNYSLKLTYALYNPSKYTKNIDELDNIKEINAIGLTKVRLIKLLDSSIEAFLYSIKNMMNNIEDTINYLQGYITKAEYEQQSIFDNEDSTVQVNKSIYSDQYILDLEHDRYVLSEIIKIWYDGTNVIDSDIKVNELIKILNNHKNEKIVIFTEFVITAKTLEEKLTKLGYRVLKVDGTDNKTKSTEVMDNFSLSGRMKNNYDILVSTNILSEGINLNRASVAINYDITWNPTIITQRVGRLNRIDTKVRQISVYNFFPCDEADKAILSESNIISKFALASYSIGTDENYLVSSKSDDTDISMLEYKEGLVAAISKNILEEQLDFRTVDFRYAKEANEVFSNEDEINSLSSKVEFGVAYTNPDEPQCIIGIFSNNGRIITCKKDVTGFYYIEYNEFLDMVKQHKLNKADKGFDYAQAKDIIDRVRLENVSNKTYSDSARAMINIILRLEDSLDELLDKQEINELEYSFKINKLSNIKRNISNGLINEYLCNNYKNEFNDKIKNSQGYINQINILINEIIPNKLSEYKIITEVNKFKILGMLQILDK